MNENTESSATVVGPSHEGRSSRIGKIARLPWAIRDELNRRLRDGAVGREIAAWLNELPEVRAVLEKDFGARPVTEHNVSEWRHGGYSDWLAKIEADAFLSDTLEKTDPASENQPGRSTLDRVADWFFPHYVAAAREQLAAAESSAARWEVLRGICADLSILRRNERLVERMQLWRDRFDLEREESAEITEEEFLTWARQQEGLEKKIWPDRNHLTFEEKQQAMRRILGTDRPSASPRPINSAAASSDQIGVTRSKSD